ncbi:MAG: hypothetical protein V7K98_23955 [Nostoc sp.]|uniref:hypothetical protein n=1 Tax=Nostoc sp. TaxID=1180 RepID=UPI002FF79F03
MYSIGAEWLLRVNRTNNATFADGKITKAIDPIEPDVVFTHSTIGIYVVCPSGKETWYRAGDLYQAFTVPFGVAGAAQGESLRLVLNRYTIHRFTTFPSLEGNKYVISFSPMWYFPDVKIQIWEYVGTNQGATLDSLAASEKQQLQRTAALQTSVNKLLRRQ